MKLFNLYGSEMDYTIKKYNNDTYELVINKYNTSIKMSDEQKEAMRLGLQNKNDFKLDNNIQRARTKIFEIALTNDFEYFITLTLNGRKHNRLDLDGFIKNFGLFIKAYRASYRNKGININLQYILIPEHHKDNTWHMHGLIKGIPKNDLFINENKYLDWKHYKKKFGFISLSPIRSQIGVSKYITKYITKAAADSKERRHKKLYYTTRGLKRPDIALKGRLSTNRVQDYIINDKVFSNDFVIKQELTKAEYLQLKDILIFDK